MTKEDFYIKWLETFGAGISETDIEKYVKSTGNYIWHIFSWDLIGKDKYLIGRDAKAAFDETDKQGAAYIAWFENERTKELTPSLRYSDALDKFTEVYVVGENFEWTYIKTHEMSCGPYFMKKQ